MLRRRLQIGRRVGEAKRQPAPLSERLSSFASVIGFLYLAATAGEAVRDQVRQLPPPPPTPQEEEASRPIAIETWRRFYPRLARRLASDKPLEVGEVWATRSMRICGYANAREEAVDNMTYFYSEHGQVRLRGDGPKRFFVVWPECLKDPWVELHRGSEVTGKCGAAAFRRSFLGALICPSPVPAGGRRR